MFKNLTILEVKGAEERIHRYECPPSTPLVEVLAGLEKMKEVVVELKSQLDEKEKEKEGESTGSFDESTEQGE